MPAIHGFDYRGNAVHVYRVEDRDGRGPWSSSYTKQWMWDNNLHGEHDPGSYLPSHCMYNQAMRFGFINATQMVEAFHPFMLERAFATGMWHVAVYETCPEAVRTMDEYQITFDIHQSKLVKRITDRRELNDVLQASAYHCEVRTFDARGNGASADVRVPDSAAASLPSPYGYEGRRQIGYREPIFMGMEA